MAYFAPKAEGRFVAALISNKQVDGTNGHSLAVWTGPDEGRARTRIRTSMMRDRASVSEIEAPNGGTVMVLPLRYATQGFWGGFLDAPKGQGTNVDLIDTERMTKLQSDFLSASGFDDKEPSVVGRNRYGYVVYDRTLGRTAHKIGDHRQIVAEWQRKDGKVYGIEHPEMFFRARNDFDLSANARSVFIDMANGQSLSLEDVDRLAGLLSTGDFSVSSRDLMEHIEGEVSRCIANGEVQGRDAIAALMQTFPKQRERTAATIAAQQYSTPFPFGLAAAEIFGDLRGASVLEPTIGNGALVASMAAAGAVISGWELDHGRFLRATAALGDYADQIEPGDFLDAAPGIERGSFDVLVANPPFDTLPVPAEISLNNSSSSFSTDKLHYAIVTDAMQRLKPGGNAFFVLPANFVNPEEKNGPAQRFHNLLMLSFDKVEEAVADGRLYAGMGTSVPVQIYAASGFRSELHPFSRLSDPDFVSAPRNLKSYEELFDWADDVRAQFGNLQSLPAPEPVAAPSDTGNTPPQTPAEPDNAGQGGGPSAPSRRGPEEPASPASPTASVRPPAPAEPTPKPPADDRERSRERQTVVLEDDPVPQWLTDSIGGDDSVPYRPFSNAGSASSVVPKSLSGAIYQALTTLSERLAKEHGPDYDVDDYVAAALSIPKEELLKGERLSPEQIDGVALCLSGIETGRGVLVGDLMGMGKGRELAAIFQASFESGDPVMFVTVKPSLFSDFLVRDLTDVTRHPTEQRMESGEINLHIVNAGQVLMDRDEKVIFKQPAKKPGETGFAVPIAANVVASTYSQFQKADTGAERLSAIQDWMTHHIEAGRKPRLILDEAHRAASPDSNTGAYFSRLCRFVEDNGGAVIWSSATGIKTGQHIELYYSALPDTGLGKRELLEIMGGGDALSLQEALSHEMAASGAMFVRQLADQGVERDLPRLVDYDPDKIMKVREKVDNATECLRDIIDFMPTITELAKDVARREFGGSVMRNGQEKLKLETNSPVTNLHHFSGYLTLATKGQFLQELVTDSLARGEKQVFTIEHLGKSILTWKMAHPGELMEDASGRFFQSPPNLGDVLKRYVEKATEIKAIDALGNTIELNLNGPLRDWIEGMHRQIDEAGLQDMRIDGADLIKAGLDKMGLACGELTGRTTGGGTGVTGEINGRYYLYDLDKGGPEATAKIANKFNDGQLDALVLNKSSSAGISIQNAPSVATDLRRRAMFKMELQADIVDERQIEGRVDRKGQLEGPRYVSPLTGFASDDRLASLFNRKNRSLSASTNATRENATNIDEVVDLLNPIGREVVFDYLKRNSSLAQGLDIDVGKEPDGDSLTRKLLGRLIVRPLDEQTRILGEIDVAYRMKADFLDRRGLNPLKTNRRDWRGKVVEEEVLLAENRASGIASQPVKLTTIEAPTIVEPLAYDAVLKAVRRGFVDAQMNGSAEEQLAKAFDGSEPKFASRPWLRTVNNMEPTTFASAESRDASKMAAELAAVHAKYRFTPFAKIKDEKERIKLEVVRNAQFLNTMAPHLQTGAGIFINASIVPEAADTRIAKAVGMESRDELWIPAVVASYHGSNSYPLDPSYHSVELAIPGEAELTKVRLGNLALHIRQTINEDNWAVADVFCSADRWLNIERDVGLTDAIERWLVDHPENKGLFDRATDPEARYGGKDQALTKRPELEELYRGLFDRTVAGTVMEPKTVLTGNMFRALILTRQKNGQSAGTKIVFSDSKGVWHHGIEVMSGAKNEKVNRIRDKAQVTAISSPNITSSAQLNNLFRLVMEQDAMQWHSRAKDFKSPLDRVKAIYGEVGGTDVAEKVRADGFPPFEGALLAPTCAFVGPDVFSEQLLEARNGIYRGLVKNAGVNYQANLATAQDSDRLALGTFRYSSKELHNAIAANNKEFKRGDLYYFPSQNGACLVLDPKNEVLQDEFQDLLALASNRSLTINGTKFSTSAGMLAVAVDWSYENFEAGTLRSDQEHLHQRICEALVRVGEATSQPVLMSGMLRSFSERFDTVCFELERAAEPDLSMDTDMSVSTTPKRKAAGPSCG